MTSSIRWVRDGLIVGLIAYAAVALFYAMFDVLAARGALYTVNQLGLAVFRGLRDPSVLGLPIPIDRAAVAMYTAVHLGASLAIGLTVVWLVERAEARPMRAQVMLLWIVAGFAFTIAVVGLLSTAIRPVLPWWSIVLANSFAVVLAGLYMMRRHPGFLSRMTVSPR